MGRALIYIADPLCAWSWGFAPVLREVVDQTGLAVHLMVGGLTAGPRAARLDASGQAELRMRWARVAEATGQAFNAEAFQQMAGASWLHDSGPACRAVIALRAQHPSAALAYLADLQEAFCAQGRDVTDRAVLIEVAQRHARDPARFAEELDDPTLVQAAQQEFQEVRDLGIQGFPTLFLRDRSEWGLAARGWQAVGPLLDGIQAWLDKRDAEEAHDLRTYGQPSGPTRRR